MSFDLRSMSLDQILVIRVVVPSVGSQISCCNKSLTSGPVDTGAPELVGKASDDSGASSSG